MGKYAAYPAYKDSGIEWLGDVPEHWQVLSIKRLSIVKRGASPRPIQDQKYFDQEGEYAWVRISDVTASEHYLENTTQRLSELGASFSVCLQPNQLFLSIAGSVGKPLINKIKCCIHDGFVYFPNLEQSPEFLYYIFGTGQPFSGLGKMGTQLNLNTDTVGAIKIGLPAINEQQQIADFLDNKTVHLDRLIGQKQQMIGLLNEKRMALITQSVTKGLDLSVPMKDSGVEWLGNVPEHWDILPLKAFLNDMAGSIKTGPFGSQLKSADMSKEGIKVYNQKNIITGDFNSGFDFISEEKYGELSSFEIFPDDLLITTRGTIGRCAIFLQGIEKGVLHPCLMRLQFKKNKLLNHFFVKLMQETKILLEQLTLKSNATTIEVIYTDTLKNLIIAAPPVSEQQQITNYLDTETKKIDDMIKTVKQAIATLQEYRTALITAAVTGKIDVRGFKLYDG